MIVNRVHKKDICLIIMNSSSYTQISSLIESPLPDMLTVNILTERLTILSQRYIVSSYILP